MPEVGAFTVVAVRLGEPAWEGLEEDAEALLAEWTVAPGDQVGEGQEIGLAELVKASVPIVSPVAGRVLELPVAVGRSLARRAVLARIETRAGDR